MSKNNVQKITLMSVIGIRIHNLKIIDLFP